MANQPTLKNKAKITGSKNLRVTIAPSSSPIENNLIGSYIEQFCTNVELIREFIELVKPTFDNHAKKLIAGDSKALDRISTIIEDAQDAINKYKSAGHPPKTPITMTFKNSEDGILFNNFSKTLTSIGAIPRHLYESSLVSLTSNIELFISQILHLNFKKYPESLTDKKEKQFSFVELSQFDTIDDAKNYLIENEVENFLRQGFDYWTKYFEQNLKLKIPFIKNNHFKIKEFF